jgi:DNA-binding LacI/PurR family transcriptional regulator
MNEVQTDPIQWRTKIAPAATLKDVAALAGVDKTSASVVLNGAKSSTGVSAARRQRILAAVAQLNYTPNGLARSLSRRRTDSISFYSGQGFLDLTDQLISGLVAGIHQGCEKHRKDLVLYGTFYGVDSPEVFRKLADGKTDGLILHTPPDNSLLPLIDKSHLPVVAVADAVPQLPSVAVDIADGAKRLADYLHSKGHRRILYRACEVRKHQTTTVTLRECVFIERAQQLSMTVDFIPVSDMAVVFTAQELDLLRPPRRDRPTAAVCWSDNSARSTLTHCANAGMRVPDDLAVAGSDGLRCESADSRRITSIRVPWMAAASIAVDLLVDLIEGKKVPHETMLPVSLSIGDTT